MRTYILGVLILCIYYSCNNKPEETPEEATTAVAVAKLPVTVQQVIDSSFNQQRIANGKLAAQQKSDLRFKIGDRIANVRVRNGQRVAKGTVLANLDNALLKNEVSNRQITLDEAKRKLLVAKINYGVGKLEEQDIDPTILKNLKLENGSLEAENSLQNMQLQYEQTFLRAPFSGIVANLEAKAGNYITTGDVFCTLISDAAMEVSFSVLESEFSSITLGQEVNIQPFATADRSYTGKITEINPLVDENGLIAIKAVLTTKDQALFDGMNVKVIINAPLDNVVVVPKQALVLRSNREVVFTISNGLAKWNYVTLAGENSTHYALKEGVKVGDTVIVSGNLNLSHDAQVQPNLITN